MEIYNSELDILRKAYRQKRKNQWAAEKRRRVKMMMRQKNKCFDVIENNGSFWITHYEMLRRKKNNIHATVETISLQEEDNEDKGNIVCIMLEKDETQDKNTTLK